MWQAAIQEVPATPQFGDLLLPYEQTLNQLVPNQDSDSQDDEDAYTVPRTPVAVDKQSTPTFTPLCRQINYNSTRASLYNHFATPRNATPLPPHMSPAEQMVPQTPNLHTTLEKAGSRISTTSRLSTITALRTPIAQVLYHFSPTYTVDSLGRSKLVMTSELRRRCKDTEANNVMTARRSDLRKQLLSSNHEKNLGGIHDPRKTYYHGSFGANTQDSNKSPFVIQQKTKILGDKTENVDGDTQHLLCGVAHRLRQDKNSNMNKGSKSRRTRENSDKQSETTEVCSPTADFLDIIDDENIS